MTVVTGRPAPARDPGETDRFWHLAAGELDARRPAGPAKSGPPGPHCESIGLVSVQPERESFSGRERAQVHIVPVAGGADGRGIGRALMGRAEARARGYAEVALDIFANSDRAWAVSERARFRLG